LRFVKVVLLDRALVQRDTLPEQHGSLVKTDHIRESFKF